MRYAYDSLLNINYANGNYNVSEKYVKVDYNYVPNADGSLSVKIIYTSANANDFVQFSTHNMPVDLLLDNVTIMCVS